MAQFAMPTQTPIPPIQSVSHSFFYKNVRTDQGQLNPKSIFTPSLFYSKTTTPTPPQPPPSTSHSLSKISLFPSSPFLIQTKLSINTPNDKYEQEADRIAEQVMRMPEPKVQRKCTSCGKVKEETIQRKPLTQEISPVSLLPILPSLKVQRRCAECEEEKMLQRKTQGQAGGMASAALTQQIQNTKGGGQPMNANTRQFMESRFGVDFEGVRIHTGSRATRMNEEVDARAFTVGRDVYFNQGEFIPNSLKGKWLLAHELTHTLQQHQSLVSNSIQREDKKSSPKKKKQPTVKDIIPFNSGDRITLNHLIDSGVIGALKLGAKFSDNIDEETIETAEKLLPQLEKRTGTLTTITDEKAIIEIDAKEKTEKSTTEKPAEEKEDKELDLSETFTIELVQKPEDKTLSILVYSGKGKHKKLLTEQDNITLKKTDKGVRLSTTIEGTSISIDIEQEAKKRIKASLSEPVSADILSITQLPKAREGSTEEKKAVEEAGKQANNARAFKRFRFRPEIGVNVNGRDPSFLMSAAFQVNFRPISSASLFLQLPLEVQLQYAPPSSVLAAINTGAKYFFRHHNTYKYSSFGRCRWRAN